MPVLKNVLWQEK